MKRNVIILLGILILASMTLALTDPPETIVLENKKGPITFTHKAHIDAGATCQSCHHNVAADMDVPTQKCVDCHGVGDNPSKKDYGHGTCLKCHKANKAEGAPTKCSGCHAKK